MKRLGKWQLPLVFSIPCLIVIFLAFDPWHWFSDGRRPPRGIGIGNPAVANRACLLILALGLVLYALYALQLHLMAKSNREKT